MSLVQQIKEAAATAIGGLYQQPAAAAGEILVNQTKPEFEGDYTLVLFALVKQLRKAPEQLGRELGEELVKRNGHLFTGYNVIKGFLNLSVADSYFTGNLARPQAELPALGQRVIVEYSSPNTNKPLHLGHLRNIFLGWSVAEILKATGNEVRKTCIANDRGIHICKSMIAWQRYGNGATPESTGIKGDHLVGDYYVRFGNVLKGETDRLEKEGLDKKAAEAQAPIMQEAKNMLLEWEQGKPEVIGLWKTMNGWVYEGFDQTYKRIGADFDKIYYESETYLLGKQFVEEGLAKGLFYRKDDGSVWIDLTAEGLDEKLLLRRDGTSLYITQDLGLAEEKHKEFPFDKSLYVIASEQEYHMNVLTILLKKLGIPGADGVVHLSYGLVELPTGRMKTREGTVVDADELIDEMVKEASAKTGEKSKVEDFTSEELKELYETIALGALKFYLLKVDPKKKMVFNPEESIDFHGFTGPFIQYTYARLRSILRREAPAGTLETQGDLLPAEKQLLLLLEQYPDVVRQAAIDYNPSAIANYIFSVAQSCNSFYTVLKVLKAESEEKKQLRLHLCARTADVIRTAMHLLGIRVPERM